MVRTKQGGSILSYVIIAIALVAVLVGSVWVIKNYDFSSKASSGDATEVTLGGSGDKKAEDKNKSTARDDKSDKTKDEQAKKDAAEKPADDKTPAATPPEVTIEESGDAVSESGAQDQTQVAELPQTGLADWTSGISASLFVGALAAYVASRRYATGL